MNDLAQPRHTCVSFEAPQCRDRGFTLLELMIAVAVMTIITAPVISGLVKIQQVSQSQQARAGMYLSLRGATELMEQEIGQAGLVSLPGSPTLSAAVTANTAAQSVNVNATTSMFSGEQLLIDTGSNEELVTLTANPTSTAITGIFANSHASGAPINVLGVFTNGVMSASTGTKLQLFGDLLADGSLVYVHYDCDTTAGTLKRSVTTVTPSATTSNTADVLLTNLTANGSGPGSTNCFTITSTTCGASTVQTTIGITLSVTATDAETGTPWTMTKTLQNLSPRNEVIACSLAAASPAVTTRLQPTPPNLPLS